MTILGGWADEGYRGGGDSPELPGNNPGHCSSPGSVFGPLKGKLSRHGIRLLGVNKNAPFIQGFLPYLHHKYKEEKK